MQTLRLGEWAGGVGGGGVGGLGCVCPDPEIREGPSLQKNFFGPLGLSLL